MDNPAKIKELLEPIAIAKHYLGTPNKVQRNRLWYKSPFRNERTPSFMVNEKGFHDFGDNWHGDIIDFVRKYYNTDFRTAMKILSSDFNLPEDEKMSKEFKAYIKQQREEEKKVQQAIENWFITTLSSLCNKLHNWQKINSYTSGEALKIGYAKEQYLEYLIDIFIDATDNEKIELYRSREEINKCGD